ncbi:hypothetical protein [Pseudodesulfovibrio sediminis]|uniref:Uncharacterized protein n=1 Tax=Pseudodesulfovibrio sediminis TaxID=2810563 RepID=A0ABN6ESM4_9BACT|nr:hypothetical protein [Pseudodesulfovibrio sediminis]BCS88455.1 hypothetical protein PSDVSF_16970 [Pseudodesulfovibrio sediminis]
MPVLDNWRLLKTPNGDSFLAGTCTGHPSIQDGPIITNGVNPTQCLEHAVVISQSGTEYRLGEKMPPDENPEFAFALLMQRALNRLYQAGQPLSKEDLEKLGELVGKVVRGEEVGNTF